MTNHSKSDRHRLSIEWFILGVLQSPLSISFAVWEWWHFSVSDLIVSAGRAYRKWFICHAYSQEGDRYSSNTAKGE